MPVATTQKETVVLPDLINMTPFTFLINPLDHITSPASDKWLSAPGTLTTTKMRAAQQGLNAGLLGSMCWPEIRDVERLQVCADLMNFLFHLDDLTDEMEAKSARSVREAVVGVMDEPEKWEKKTRAGDAYPISVLTLDLWNRIRKGSGPLVQKRFRDTMDEFFGAVTEEAADRKRKTILNVDEYILRRRANGAVRPSFVLIEYANDFQLPEHVWGHPIVRNLEDWANDMVSWANDMLSFAAEYGRGDTSNIVISIMHEKGLNVQEAMNHAGELFASVVDRFVQAKSKLPSWGVKTDRHVQLYIQGLEYWVVGSTEWCFYTKRYFEDGMKVRRTRVMEFQHPQKK